jgi:hypothetical protein
MDSQRVQNFINGTTTTLPHVSLDQSVSQEVWDILRPNRQTSGFVARVEIARRRFVAIAVGSGRHARFACLAERRMTDANPSRKGGPQ